MPSTERRQRRIDAKLPETSAAVGTPVTTSAGTAVSPEIPTPVAPSGLTVVGSFVAYAAVTPEAVVNLRWVAVLSPTPDAYAIQWALDSGFTNPTTIITAREQVTAAVSGLPVNTTVHFRIAARWQWVQSAWSASVSTTTPQDTTPPAAPTGLITNWNGRTGDLTITWTNPTSVNFRDVRLRISASSGGTLYRTVFSSAGRYVYTLAQNRADSSSNGDTSVFLELDSRAFNGVFSTTTITATTSATAPATPTGMTVDFDEPDCAFNWTASPSVVGYRLSLDGFDRDLGFSDRYTYTLAQNAAEHGGNADPVLSWSLVAYDIFGVTSSAATGTATSPAPSAPSNVAITAFFSTLAVTVTHTPLPTHRTYQYRITRNSGAFITTKQNSQVFTTSISAGGTYQAFVLVEDVFGRQTSPETSSAAVVADTLTIAELRAEGTYTDNQTVNNTLTDGTNTLIDNNTLVLVDGDDLNELKDNSTTSSGVTYSAGTAWQNATRFERPLTERYRTITAGLFAPTTNTQMYVSTSVDGSTWRWFAGPLTSVTSVSATLSEVISETAARAAPVAIGSNATVTRWDLPRIVEARYVRLHHRNTTPASYVLYEFYPRRLVQSDDIEAESIRAINIAAKTITADQIAAGTITATEITVTNLSSLSANLGTITAGTVTGATIRTGASGARVVLDSTGLTTYNSSSQAVIEVTTANNGELRAGQGVVRLNRDGLQVFTSTSSSQNEIQFIVDPNDILAPAISRGKKFSSVNGFFSLLPFTIITEVSSYKTAVGDTSSTRISAYNESNVLQGRVDVQNDSIGFTTSAASRLTIDSNGLTILSSGAIRFGSSGSLFNAYEEGTWTPTYTTDGTASFSSITYSTNRVGRFVKLGQLIIAWFVIETSTLTVGSASGNVQIGGLTYGASNITALNYAGSIGNASGFGTNTPNAIVVPLNTQRATLYYRDASDGASITLKPSDMTAGAGNLLVGTIIYR